MYLYKTSFKENNNKEISKAYYLFDKSTLKKSVVLGKELEKLIKADQVKGCRLTDEGKYLLRTYDLSILCEKWLKRLKIMTGAEIVVTQKDDAFMLKDISFTRKGNIIVCEIPKFIEEFYYGIFDCIDVILCNYKLIHKANQVKEMPELFTGIRCSSLDLSEFSTEGCINIDGMFNNCNAQNLDLSGFDTSSIREMDAIFDGAYIRGYIDMSSFNLDNCICPELFGGLILDGGKVLVSHQQSEKTLNNIKESLDLYGYIDDYTFKD